MFDEMPTGEMFIANDRLEIRGTRFEPLKKGFEELDCLCDECVGSLCDRKGVLELAKLLELFCYTDLVKPVEFENITRDGCEFFGGSASLDA